MKFIKFLTLLILAACLFSCGRSGTEETSKETSAAADTMKYQTDQFADLRILRYTVPGFEQLTPKQKELTYYLYEAALSGKDIIWDQNYKYNLAVRKALEAIVATYKGDKNTDDYKKFMVYAKRVWYSNGIHHHYSNIKFTPECSKEYFAELVKNSDIPADGTSSPLNKGETVDGFITRITPIVFDPAIAPKKINLDSKQDMVTTSATNFYEGVNQKEVTAFYDAMNDTSNKTPISYGLNSKLVKENGKIFEKVWKVGGEVV